MVYDLDYWPRNLLYNFALNDCLFGATNIVKISGKSKYVHNGSGIAFNGAGSWSFGNDAAINVLIFGADNN